MYDNARQHRSATVTASIQNNAVTLSPLPMAPPEPLGAELRFHTMSAVHSLEDLIEQLGNPGRFQVVLILMLQMQEIPVAWATLMMSVFAKVPDWWCPGAFNATTGCFDCTNETYQYCPANQTTCDYPYFDPQMATVVSEWNLICDSEAVTATMTSIQMAGNLVGAIVSGQISDAFGRKVALYLCLLILTVFCTVAGFATSWQMFTVCSFFIGIACGGYLVTCYPQSVEFVRARWRTTVGAFPFWTLGLVLFGFVAWIIHDVRHFCFFIAAIEAPILLTYRLFPESIRWQLSRGRVHDAKRSINRIIKMNQIQTPDLSQLQMIAEHEQTLLALQKKYTFIHLFNSKEKIKTAAVFHAMWFISSVMYYGLSLGARTWVGSVYLNITLTGLTGLPRIPIVIYLNDRIGRRWTSFCFYLLCSVACFTVAACSAADLAGLPTINFSLALTAQMSVTVAWAAMKVFTAEHYPTVIRTLGLSACNIAAGLGSILAPYMVLMTEHGLVVPYAVMGILILTNVGLPFLLEETAKKPLEDAYSRSQVENCNQTTPTNT
ncbi:organic cation transporter protein-like [Haliotis asinina]|uniref:organic cation transporter protein-like n=1 Tax=Haliotis asinina TaxID=109174 RepID=UPI003531FEB2